MEVIYVHNLCTICTVIVPNMTNITEFEYLYKGKDRKNKQKLTVA